jgi:hypothetical protein
MMAWESGSSPTSFPCKFPDWLSIFKTILQPTICIYMQLAIYTYMPRLHTTLKSTWSEMSRPQV